MTIYLNALAMKIMGGGGLGPQYFVLTPMNCTFFKHTLIWRIILYNVYIFLLQTSRYGSSRYSVGDPTSGLYGDRTSSTGTSYSSSRSDRPQSYSGTSNYSGRSSYSGSTSSLDKDIDYKKVSPTMIVSVLKFSTKLNRQGPSGSWMRSLKHSVKYQMTIILRNRGLSLNFLVLCTQWYR